MAKKQAKPSSLEVIEYSWWDGINPPPERLKTRKQLSEMSLAPVAHVGEIITKKYTLKLYDPTNDKSVRKKRKASQAQLAALEKGRRRSKFKQVIANWMLHDGWLEEDRVTAVHRARNILKHPEKWRILDTETSGLYSSDRVVELAVTDLVGNPVIDSLIQPIGDWTMSSEAAAVHGILEDDLLEAPLFSDLHPQLIEVTKGCNILTYGADFDSRMIKAACNRATLPWLEVEWVCLMNLYAKWYGDWDFQRDNYTWQPLDGSHRALGDCQTALEHLREIADDSIEFRYPQWLVEAAVEAGEELPSR